jgi:hypothetical protein
MPAMTIVDYMAMASVAIGMFLFTWMPYDRKHFPLVALGIVLSSAGLTYLCGYVAIAAVFSAVGAMIVAKHLWHQRTRNGQADI